MKYLLKENKFVRKKDRFSPFFSPSRITKPKLVNTIAVLFFCFLVNGQKSLKCSTNPIYFFDESTDQFTCLDDSFEINRYDFKHNEWNQSPILFLSNELFEKFKTEFRPVSINSRGLFFVHSSGGEVYEFKNDTLKRIDRSFQHRNKYYSALFHFNNEIFNFGGYGLFRDNNTLIKFDTLINEWIEIPYKSISPKSRHSFAFHVDSKGIYILGGFSTNIDDLIKINDVWYFDFTSQKWIKKGDLNPFWMKNILIRNNINNLGSYNAIAKFCHGPYFIEIDFINNSYEVYKNNYFQGYFKYCFDKTGSNLLYLGLSSGNQSYNLLIVKSNLLKGKLIYKGSIWTKKIEQSNHWIFIFAAIILIFIVFVLYKLLKKLQVKNYRLERKLFSEREWEILIYFTNQKGRRVEMSKINDFVDETGISYDTLKKRRETLIKDLRQKISSLTELSQEEVFSIHNHPDDKRAKILELNNLLQF